MRVHARLLSYLVQPFPVYFLAGLVLLNSLAISQFDPLYIGSLFAFIYIVVTPGFLLLPFLTEKKLPPTLGVAFSVALSVFILMLVGLGLNTVLPFFGMMQPLSTTPLLIAYDVLVYALLIFNYVYRKSSPFEFHEFNALNWAITGAAFFLPVFASIGAIILNNGGSNFLSMALLALSAVLVPIIVFERNKVNATVPPLTLYLMALAFLLTNSMRGWYITGHDILLEYHVFMLTNTAHLWNMAFYQDPYMACLSLTILPTYLINLLHVGPAYIFKFFAQFLGALSVIFVYYLTKQYTSDKIAFLTGFLYISFPTFLVDMAFLNRQDIAFVFFGAVVFTLLTEEYFGGWKRKLALFVFGIGIILSHYSTSYVTIGLLVIAYVLNRVIRILVTAKKPLWLFRLTEKMPNKEIYRRPILLTLPFVLGLLAIMLVWSTFITRTSTGLFNTIEQIFVTIQHPFSLDEFSGPAKYNLLGAQQPTPQQLLSQFVADSMQEATSTQPISNFYPSSVTQKYPAIPLSEALTPITYFGGTLQTTLHINLVIFYGYVKQLYAKIIQLLLLVGLVGLVLGYSFKKKFVRDIPAEYVALSIAGVFVMFGQTILPATAIDYGLLRLFQQNLIFLGLPIMLSLLLVCSFFVRSIRGQLVLCTAIMLFFFIMLSGLFSQFTGGARAPLPLDNYGLYYDSYYTHAQEVYSAQWLAQNGDTSLSIQAAHFSDIKMLAYGNIGANITLLPQTLEKRSYVYLNYDNVQTSNILEIIGGNVIYYHFPLQFLQQNKNLIYNNGGSEIYR